MSRKDNKNDYGPHIAGPTYRKLEAQRDRLAELLRASVAVFERAAAELCRDLDHDVRVMAAVEMHRRAVASELAAIEKEKQS